LWGPSRSSLWGAPEQTGEEENEEAAKEEREEEEGVTNWNKDATVEDLLEASYNGRKTPA
jgi:hypothetical protein